MNALKFFSFVFGIVAIPVATLFTLSAALWYRLRRNGVQLSTIMAVLCWIALAWVTFKMIPFIDDTFNGMNASLPWFVRLLFTYRCPGATILSMTLAGVSGFARQRLPLWMRPVLLILPLLIWASIVLAASLIPSFQLAAYSQIASM